MKKKELSVDDIRDYWLTKYHNTNSETIIRKQPELANSPDWFNEYAVTQEQHDEWYDHFISEIMLHFKIGKKAAKHRSSFLYLDVAPSVITK